ncbi:hypothetical protein EON65_26145 [archaeon]|nr:MAG: hypothetical protein EON65_26145 [archaeon]
MLNIILSPQFQAFPLFQYCPVYGTVLDEGDVLFNPPYWWHSIRNVTETTVGKELLAILSPII